MRSRIAIPAVLAALAAAQPAAAAPPFTAAVTNPYFPLQPGNRWVYRGVEDGRRLRNVVRVLDRVEVVDGVPCAVVQDRVYLDGRLAESTFDWYSQDAGGTVWYFGEDTKELDRRGRVKSTEGSWRAGVDGAREGIYMPAHPRAGSTYQQEHYAGHAEDRFRILSLRSTVHLRWHTYRHALKTKEWTPLEPEVEDRKWYVRGIGQVAERTVRGGSDHAKLVSFSRRPS